MESPPKISSLVLFGADSGLIPDSGAPLVDEGHEEGPAHMATELGDIHFAICQAEVEGRASARRAACSTFGGFHVAPLDHVEHELTSAGATLLTEPEQMP
jgi:hypothetical protein